MLVQASPGAGWQFGHWEGDVSAASRMTYVTMNADKTITAVMKANLRTEKDGPGTISPAEGDLYLYTPQQVQRGEERKPSPTPPDGGEQGGGEQNAWMRRYIKR